jgi:hypothetical protein
MPRSVERGQLAIILSSTTRSFTCNATSYQN